MRRSQRSRSTARAPSADAALHLPQSETMCHLPQSKTMSQGCREQSREQARVVDGGVHVIKNSSVVIEDIFFGNDDDACVFAES